jgi:hypothetical protein
MNEALPWIMKGYIARITDEQGVVKFTQALANGPIATYPGDATGQRPDPNQVWGWSPPPGSRQTAQAPKAKGEYEEADPPKRPWWKFW